jgi:hypothetical protein
MLNSDARIEDAGTQDCIVLENLINAAWPSVYAAGLNSDRTVQRRALRNVVGELGGIGSAQRLDRAHVAQREISKFRISASLQDSTPPPPPHIYHLRSTQRNVRNLNAPANGRFDFEQGALELVNERPGFSGGHKGNCPPRKGESANRSFGHGIHGQH